MCSTLAGAQAPPANPDRNRVHIANVSLIYSINFTSNIAVETHDESSVSVDRVTKATAAHVRKIAQNPLNDELLAAGLASESSRHRPGSIVVQHAADIRNGRRAEIIAGIGAALAAALRHGARRPSGV